MTARPVENATAATKRAPRRVLAGSTAGLAAVVLLVGMVAPKAAAQPVLTPLAAITQAAPAALQAETLGQSTRVLPATLADGFTVNPGTSSVHVAVAGATKGDGHDLGYGLRSYPDLASGGQVVLQQSSNGAVRALEITRNPQGPVSYTFTFTDPGDRTILAPDGAIVVERSNKAVTEVPAPWAYNQAGKAVDAHYTLVGTNGVALVINPPAGTKLVVSDPWYDRWFGWSYVLTRGQTSEIASSIGSAASFIHSDGWEGAALGIVGSTVAWSLAQAAIDNGECLALNFAYWGFFPGLSGC